MSRVSVRNLVKDFHGDPPTVAVDHLDLEIEDGEFLVLLGPSGCGKTTTLRCLAGLEQPTGGRIELGDQVAFDAEARINRPPDKRFIGMVFQSYALWPHMSVRKNIGYPLKARKLEEELRGGRVEETADLVDCGRLLDRYPSQLSGGQQQRVALARGIVARPDLVLFDEPLSNLDARLRDQVRGELHELHRRNPFTAVFVTHDQSEALSLGTRMAIMNKGRIEQLDAPREVFENPRTEYVAEFMGMSNALACELIDGRWHVSGVKVQGAIPTWSDGQPFTLRMRPEHLRFVSGAHELREGESAIEVQVQDVEFGGLHYDVVVAPNAHGRLHARVPAVDDLGRRIAPRRDDVVLLAFAAARGRRFDTDGLALTIPEPALASGGAR